MEAIRGRESFTASSSVLTASSYHNDRNPSTELTPETTMAWPTDRQAHFQSRPAKLGDYRRDGSEAGVSNLATGWNSNIACF
ncbi:hypothetical protein CKAH01_06730 [Colletotrichum kahawae]|uniref:Uncharacterized protein n=1 Tax=Colletotrichum kahawae TaxID=34407 RepID=A0AAD9Y6T6_COLKA|nr:hypothetical protein CKAH01_06730 [Colletotrichum kahawae]